MKRVFLISMIALSAGVVAFVVTLVNFENSARKNIDIVPIRVDSDKEYAVAESSIRINPKVIEKEESKKIDVKVNDVKTKEVVAKPKKEVSFAKPCNGNVVTTFSENNLLYSNTLKEWIIHDGVDISVESGDSILAICDGKVIDVRYDYKLGNVVEVESGEYVVKYACIEPIDGLKVGNEIKLGDKIAVASTDAGFELDNGLHLHLEILKDNIQVNPNSVI